MEIHEQRRSFTSGHGARGSVDLLVEHTVSDRPLLLAIMFHFLGRLQYIISLSFVFFLLFSSSFLVTMGHPHHFLAPLEAFLHFLKSCWAWVSKKDRPPGAWVTTEATKIGYSMVPPTRHAVLRRAEYQWIGLRENLQETPIFNGKNHGFL